jgi:hypothetical protein
MLSSEEICWKFRHILFVLSFQCCWKTFGVFVVSFRVVGSHFVFDTNVEDVDYSLLRDLDMLGLHWNLTLFQFLDV